MTRSGRPGPAEVVRPGLDRIVAALELSGHPERAFRTLHVAGTNGKGSTSAFLEAIVRGALRRPVGLYTSPHLVSAEERLRISGRKIAGRALGRLLNEASRLSAAVERSVGERLSFFEEMTWAACAWFSRRGVGTVVMEAGLGGRWDATTACRPAVTVITSVGIDHRDWLGSTLGAIASEKAGIVRAGVPLIVGRLRPPARRVVLARAREAGAPAWELDRDFGWTDAGAGRIRVALPGVDVPPVRPGMEGLFQRDNAAVACAAAWRFLSAETVSPGSFRAAARRALSGTRLAGRLSEVPGRRRPRVFADGAHNPDAARALAGELPRLKRRVGARRVVALWSMLADKDIRGFLRALAPAVDGIAWYPLVHPRAAGAGKLEAAARESGLRADGAADFPGAWKKAAALAGPGGVVVVCGSLVAVGDAFRCLAGGEVP